MLTGCAALLEEVQHQVSNAAAAAETAGRQLEVVLRHYSEHAIELSVPGVPLYANEVSFWNPLSSALFIYQHLCGWMSRWTLHAAGLWH